MVFVWIPYAFWFLRKKLPVFFSKSSLREINFLTLENEISLEKTKKELESILAEDIKLFPTFEFRETIERYIGLTIANRTENQKPTDKENDFHKISDEDNKKLAAKCLHRRNLRLLNFHHNLARKDFLKFISKYKDDLSEAENLYYLLLKLIKTLRDDEAESVVKNNFSFITQSAKDISVTNLEKEVWTPETHKQPPAKSLTSPLKTMTAPANLPFKD